MTPEQYAAMRHREANVDRIRRERKIKPQADVNKRGLEAAREALRGKRE